MRSRFIAVVALAAIGGWLAIDGGWAMLTGNYADFDGALEPWADVVIGAGLDPASWLVRIAHVGIGVLALLAAFTIAAGWGSLAWWLGVVAAFLVLWYFPFGTIAGAATLITLLMPGPRLAIRGH
jgi:hypothetical protein